MRNLTLLCYFTLTFFYAGAQRISISRGEKGNEQAFIEKSLMAANPLHLNRHSFSEYTDGINSTYLPDSSIVSKYTSCLLPVPQQVSLQSTTFLLDNSWSLEPQNNKAFIPAITSLNDGLQEQKILLRNSNTSASHVIKLVIQDGSITVRNTTDTNHAALEKQAYRLL